MSKEQSFFPLSRYFCAARELFMSTALAKIARERLSTLRRRKSICSFLMNVKRWKKNTRLNLICHLHVVNFNHVARNCPPRPSDLQGFK